LRPFSNASALDFLKFAPIVATAAAGVGVFWLGRKSAVRLERYFFLGLAACFVGASILMAYPPVLHAIQGIFWFGAKVLGFLYAFIWYRATFPRFRYDQLMNVGWRFLIPLALTNLVVTAVVIWWKGPHVWPLLVLDVVCTALVVYLLSLGTSATQAAPRT
jgi:NADH-quinone oxidoreductase subunit H